MTLILSFLSHEHVVQVSDRRLSRVQNNQFVGVGDDESNKAVIAYNLVAFGYTGLATIGDEPTDLWLWDRVQAIRPYNHSTALRSIADAATLSFAELHLPPEHLQHAFVAVGWGRPAMSAPYSPFIATVSNALDRTGRRWLQFADRQFVASPAGVLATGTPWHVAWHGQNLDERQAAQLMANIKTCVRRGPPRPGQIIRVLAECIRVVAKTNPYVGKSLMAVSLPRCEAGVVEGMIVPMTSRVPDDKAVAMYLPQDLSTRSWYLPHYVGTTGSIGDVQVHLGPEESLWWDPVY